jgi:hypothetical protein
LEFVCDDPEAAVRAANVRATLDAFSLVPSVGERLATKHGLQLRDLTADKFVPVQRWLDALKEIQLTVGTEVVRRVGAKIIETADFPPKFETVESVLEALDTIYYLNHRGDVGHYRCQRENSAVVVRCETPYPRHFEWGLIDGICRSRLARGRRYLLSYEPGPPNGNLTCTITVRVPAST